MLIIRNSFVLYYVYSTVNTYYLVLLWIYFLLSISLLWSIFIQGWWWRWLVGWPLITRRRGAGSTWWWTPGPERDPWPPWRMSISMTTQDSSTWSPRTADLPPGEDMSLIPVYSPAVQYGLEAIHPSSSFKNPPVGSLKWNIQGETSLCMYTVHCTVQCINVHILYSTID